MFRTNLNNSQAVVENSFDFPHNSYLYTHTIRIKVSTIRKCYSLKENSSMGRNFMVSKIFIVKKGVYKIEK